MKQKWCGIAVVSIVAISAVAWADGRVGRPALSAVQPVNMSVTSRPSVPQTIEELKERLVSEKIYGLVNASKTGTPDPECEATVSGALYRYFKKVAAMNPDPLRSKKLKRGYLMNMNEVRVDFAGEFSTVKRSKKSGSDIVANFLGISSSSSGKARRRARAPKNAFGINKRKGTIAVVEVATNGCQVPDFLKPSVQPTEVASISKNPNQDNEPESPLCTPSDPGQRDPNRRMDAVLGARSYPLRTFSPNVTAGNRYEVLVSDIDDFDQHHSREEFKQDVLLNALMRCGQRAREAWTNFLCRKHGTVNKVTQLISDHLIDETRVRGLYLDSGIDYELAHKEQSFKPQYYNEKPRVLSTSLRVDEILTNGDGYKKERIAELNNEIRSIQRSSLSIPEKAKKIAQAEKEIKRVQNLKKQPGNRVTLEYIFNEEEFLAAVGKEEKFTNEIAGCHYVNDDSLFMGLVDRAIEKRIKVRNELSIDVVREASSSAASSGSARF